MGRVRVGAGEEAVGRVRAGWGQGRRLWAKWGGTKMSNLIACVYIALDDRWIFERIFRIFCLTCIVWR